MNESIEQQNNSHHTESRKSAVIRKRMALATSAIAFSGLILMSGCASNPESSQLVSDTTVVEQAQAAKPTTPSKSKTTEAASSQTVSQSEKSADALVASLAAKAKYAVVEEVAPQKMKASAKAKVKKASKVVSKKVAKQEKPKVKKLIQKAIDAGWKELPISIELWTLREKASQSGELELITPTWQVGEGDYLSQIWLTLKPDALRINSASDLDLGLEGSGVKINGGELIPFSKVEDGNIAVIKGDYMDELANGGELEIFTGFFPDKKNSPLFKSEASLDALSRLAPIYMKLSH